VEKGQGKKKSRCRRMENPEKEKAFQEGRSSSKKKGAFGRRRPFPREKTLKKNETKGRSTSPGQERGEEERWIKLFAGKTNRASVSGGQNRGAVKKTACAVREKKEGPSCPAKRGGENLGGTVSFARKRRTDRPTVNFPRLEGGEEGKS